MTSMSVRRNTASRAKSGPTAASLFSDAFALAQDTALAPFRLALASATWVVRTTTPPLLPLAILAVTTPIIMFMSLATGFYVWKSGSVGWKATLDFQYGDGKPPYAQTSLPGLSAVEPYDILLHLTLPATTSNYDLGNFMASLTLETTKNKTVTSVRKTAIVLPPSGYLFRTPKKLYLTIPLLKDHVAGMKNLIASVDLGRKDGWKSVGSGAGREVSVLSASLEGVLKYHGIRGAVSKYPILSAIVSTATFFIVSFSTLALFLAPAIFWRYADEEATPVKEAIASSPVSEKSLKRKPVSKRSTSRGVEERVKNESEDIGMPSSSTPSTPLRRRRSKQSNSVNEE